MHHLRDEELMCEYQKGNAQAMDELLSRYKNPLYRFVFRLSNNAAEAQDIAQEVFLRVHQYRQSYEPKARFSTWIFTIAHHLFVSSLRKKKWLVFWPRQKDNDEELMDFQNPDPPPDEVVANNDLAAVVQKCIQGLPFLQKEALILREYEKLNYQEIGRILRKSQGTVKTLIHRARENLKIKLLPYVAEIKGGYHE